MDQPGAGVFLLILAQCAAFILMAVLPNKGSFVVATIGSVAGMAGPLVMIKSPHAGAGSDKSRWLDCGPPGDDARFQRDRAFYRIAAVFLF